MPQKRITGFQSCAWVFGFVAMSSLLAACQAPNLSLNRSTPAKLVVAPLREPVEPFRQAKWSRCAPMIHYMPWQRAIR